MFLDFFKWWYGVGWLGAWRSVGSFIKRVELMFSIPVLLRNLFAPWKQIVSLPGKALNDKFKALIDNLVSRSIGFIVRLGTLLVAAIIIVLASIAGLAAALAWPALPAALIYSLVRMISG